MGKGPDYRWEDIRTRMRDLRLLRGYSQDACAEAMGLKTADQYNKREAGVTQVSLEELARLRDFLGAPPWWPLIPAEDSYLIAQRTGGPSARLDAYFREHPEIPPELQEEMSLRIKGDAAEWDDVDLDMVHMIALKHLAKARGRERKPPPPRDASPSAQPGKQKAGGGKA